MASNTGAKGGQYGNTNASKYTEEQIVAIGVELLEWLRRPQNYWIDEFLVEKDLYDDFLSYYCEKYNSFSDLIRKAKKIQASKIIKGGMNRGFSDGMAKFVLINNHGYLSEKQQREVTNVNPVPIEIVQNVVSKDARKAKD